MLSIVPLLLAAAMFAPVEPLVAPLTETAVMDAPTRRIRTTHRSVRTLLERGYRHSAAFRAMVHRLQRSDLFVYVEEAPHLPSAIEGRMMMLSKAHGHRYVRIQSRCAARRQTRSPCSATSCSTRWRSPTRWRSATRTTWRRCT